MMHEYEYIAHYGTKGMEWGKRLFQNKDGSLTPLGRVHYGVGEARKKASDAIKKAPKAAGEAIKKTPSKIKKTFQDLASDRRAAKAASIKRRAQVRQERFEAKQAKRDARNQALAQKLIARNSMQTLKELQKAWDERSLEKAKKRVSELTAKKERAYEKALLKEQARQLKAETKKAARQGKKDARKRYSRNDIKNLTDEELAARKNRLKAELDLVALEAERNAPMVSAGMKWIGNSAGKGLSTGVDKLTGTVAIKVGKNLLKLSDDDINLFKTLTKK